VTSTRPTTFDLEELAQVVDERGGGAGTGRDLNLEVEAGEMVAIVGQSGAGKSTLLHILGALDAPSAGTVYCASTNVANFPAQAAAFRNREIGYVWQFHYLLPEFTALENVAMPLLARGMRKTRRRWKWRQTGSGKWDWKIAATIGPASFPAASSSAWRWRARWSTIPRLLLADEPTGDLDETTAGRVFDLIERLHASHGLTSILVTHNLDLAARCTRALRLEGGRLTPLAQPAPQTAIKPGKFDGKAPLFRRVFESYK
jgi:lipoprotein-releasing system ATP-binding protein